LTEFTQAQADFHDIHSAQNGFTQLAVPKTGAVAAPDAAHASPLRGQAILGWRSRSRHPEARSSG
jgi:hypothetical protein